MFISDIGKIYKNEINLYDMVNGLAPRVVKYTNIIDKVDPIYPSSISAKIHKILRKKT